MFGLFCFLKCLKMSIVEPKRKKTIKELLNLWMKNEAELIQSSLRAMEYITNSHTFRKNIENGQHIITVPMVSDGSERFKKFTTHMQVEINQGIFTETIKSEYGLNCIFSTEELHESHGYFDHVIYTGNYVCVHIYPNLTEMAM